MQFHKQSLFRMWHAYRNCTGLLDYGKKKHAKIHDLAKPEIKETFLEKKIQRLVVVVVADESHFQKVALLAERITHYFVKK